MDDLSRSQRRLKGGLLPVALVLFLPASATAADETEFTRNIAPLLARRCVTCHNPDDREGELSLSTSAELAASGILQPGDADRSHLLSVLVADTPEGRPRMPKDGTPLTPAEIEWLRQWINAGAAWPEGLVIRKPVVNDFEWWSLRPLKRPPVPASASAPSAWARNPIDAFVFARLQEAGLQPSTEADRRALIRRLTLDLTGLPPAPVDVAAFLSDGQPGAYERLVNRLLDSPQYGEHWARHWLDVVRYADTCGYDKDKPRPHAWPYRDYVIRSFNDDKPYSRFVQEQLAGDVLFPGESDGILGLGFIAAGPWDFIGHVEVPESKLDGLVARNLDRDDMVSATLNTFCSVTIQCARCHNHKFDPITQEHYYSLQSVFAAVDRADRVYDTDPAAESRRRALTEELAGLDQQLKQLHDMMIRDGGEQLRELDRRIAELEPLAEPVTRPPEYGWHSGLALSPDEQKWVEVDLGRDQPLTAIVLHPCHDDFNGIGAGFGFPDAYRLELWSAASRSAGQPPEVSLPSETRGLKPGIAAVTMRVDATARFVRVTATRLAPRQNDYIFALAELEALDAAGQNVAESGSVTSRDSIEAHPRWQRGNLTDGLWPQPGDPDASAELSVVQRDRTALWLQIDTPELQAQREQLTAARNAARTERDALPDGQLVYAAATSFPSQGHFIATQGRPRTVRLLRRGQESQPGEEVRPGTIPLRAGETWQFSLPPDHTEADRRAALARWIVRDDNPLTWRSIVNRIWQYHFGRGLVDSPNDFGRMGQSPSHPELLDWLAVEFRDGGQSWKTLHRLIVTSATYRQAVVDSGPSLERDADNRWLGRASRRRLTAEELRDAVLFISGRLDLTPGGPGFPLFVLEKPEHSPHYEYTRFDPEDPRTHRRSVYRFVVRSQPDPFMTTLDCADSVQSTPRRHETLTALQALSLMNNPFQLSMARHFAARLDSELPGSDMSTRAARGFEMVTGRSPDADELQRLTDFANRHGLPALCRLLFNLNEFVFVE
jgi:hypothetical protein